MPGIDAAEMGLPSGIWFPEKMAVFESELQLPWSMFISFAETR